MAEVNPLCQHEVGRCCSLCLTSAGTICADYGKGSFYVEKEGLTLLVPHFDGSHEDVICGVLNVHNFS